MNPTIIPTPIEILLAEDSPTDVLLAKEALANSKVMNTLNVVDDGVECLAYLRREGAYANRALPNLILLDLNMPRKGGLEVLKEIKEDPLLRCIPVVILTTSKSEEDVIKSYGLYANCFISKPVDFPQFAAVIRSITNFWFTVVTLPPVNN